jgi:hypothetical protein
VPEEIKYLFLEYWQFRLPYPICKTEQDLIDQTAPLHRWGQFQLRCKPYDVQNIFLHDEELDDMAYNASQNKGFILAVTEHYGREAAVNFIKTSTEGGLRAVSSANWGWHPETEKPIIFDNGMVRRVSDI